MDVFEEQEYARSFSLELWKKYFIIQTLPEIHAYFNGGYGRNRGIDAVFPLMNRYAVDHFIVPGT